MTCRFKSGLAALALVTLGGRLPCQGQTSMRAPAPAPAQHQDQQKASEAEDHTVSDPRAPGSIRGTIVDESGAAVAGAHIKLTRDDPSDSREATSDNDGEFSFSDIAPGAFTYTITADGFAPRTSSGILHSGENYAIPQIALGVATAITEVQVRLTTVEVAAEQIKVEEKQHVLGIVPNFYVSYIPNPAPLSPRQKFGIAWKTVVDPFTIVVVGGAAGVAQAQNHFAGYGQGAQGYGKRFGAAYADTAAGTFIGAAILPSLLKQDPRYFYKGSGSKPSRFLYAIANSVICKGDNGHWQTNYSNILGNLAAGGISNLYYPAQDRDGAGLTFENGAIGIGTTAIYNLFQEFVIRKLTPKLPKQDPAKP